MHSILKFVFLEIQNKAIRPVLSGPVTLAKELKDIGNEKFDGSRAERQIRQYFPPLILRYIYGI